jgi:hypothetical protein
VDGEKKRQGAVLTRLMTSKIANWLIGRVTGIRLHDHGCSLKTYRADLIREIHLYRELY